LYIFSPVTILNVVIVSSALIISFSLFFPRAFIYYFVKIFELLFTYFKPKYFVIEFVVDIVLVKSIDCRQVMGSFATIEIILICKFRNVIYNFKFVCQTTVVFCVIQ